MQKPVIKIAAGGFFVVVAGLIGYFGIRPDAQVVDGHVVGTKVQLTIQNSGNATAYGVTLTNLLIQAGPYPPQAAASFIKPSPPIELRPGEELIHEQMVETPSRHALETQQAAIYARGTVECRDWLGLRHRRSFNLIYGGPYRVDVTNMRIWEQSR